MQRSNEAKLINSSLSEENELHQNGNGRVFSRLHDYKLNIVWFNVIFLIYMHVFSIYGLYLAFTKAKVSTVIFAYFLHMVTVVGELAGAHRLWSHRAFKANLGLRIFLMIANSIAYEDTIYSWARNHRLHHKFSDTDADPYNTKRGLFFAHVGWLMVRKHPQVIEKGKDLDLSDLHKDAPVMFQKRYQHFLVPFMAFVLPTIVPVYLWSESWSCSWYVACVLRWVIHSNGTWLINSAAHCFGYRPYDKNIKPTENYLVTVATLGEGWHNYHHTFPWDYRAAELGNFRLNLSTWFIEFCAKMGWAWDLKTTKLSMVQQRSNRTGDGTYGQNIWGWGDKDMAKEDREEAVIYHETQRNLISGIEDAHDSLSVFCSVSDVSKRLSGTI